MLGFLAGAIFLILVVASLAGLLTARLHLEKEKRRADAAESRSRSYFSVIEVFARSMKEEGPSGRDREQLLDAARREGLSESELSALGERLGPAAAAKSGGPSKPAVIETRYLFVSFEEEIRRAARRGEPLTLLTLEAGSSAAGRLASDPAVADRILRGVAHAVRGQMRGCDTCIRYGAREFILILPGVSRDEAARVERRIRTAVQAVTVEPQPGIVLQVHPTLGSATFPDDGSSFDPLLTLADIRRSRDAGGDFPGGAGSKSSVTLPWQSRPVSSN
jgi:diguanylate cyclase (GGDEF)-like protein